MDMKKILQNFDSAASKPKAEATDMKKFLSIVSEAAKDPGVSKEKETQFHKKLDKLVHKTFGKRKEEMPAKESVISSFDEDSLGGEVNSFLLAADDINKKFMSEVDKIKINADQTLLKDLMDKFNAFMSAYDAVGKEILQPDLFKDDVDLKMNYKDYFNLEEAKKKMKGEDPCWKGYKMVGTKKKGGREVPNCVPGKKGD